jgi:hypothetical protein
MTDLPKLENALTVVMSHGELEAFATDNFSISAADILKSDSASEIPGVGLVLSLLRDGVAVRDQLFQQKLFTFLRSLNSIPKDERAAMIEKLDNDADYGRKVGEHLIELIDRIEKHKKPRMLARIFRAYNSAEIDATMLHRLLHAVEHLPAFEISAVRRLCAGAPVVPDKEGETLQSLSVAGLMYTQSGFGSLVYVAAPAAEAFLRLELDQQE